MSVTHRTFREQVLAALQHAKVSRPGAQLHLLYTPELHDPVPEATDARREAAIIRAPHHIAVAPPQSDGDPRLITLDTRRVAPYLLEHDTALDDPLLETSINQAYAEVVLGERADAHLDNSPPNAATCTVGGWIASKEDAKELARRIVNFSVGWIGSSERQWVRWTQPQVLCAMWPLLNAEQRGGLLGDAAWVVFDASGQLRTLSAERLVEGDHDPASEARLGRLNANQTAILRNLPLVQELLAAWRQLAEHEGRALPADAEHRLHFHVQEAQSLKLPDSEVPAYALTAAPLSAEAMRSTQWQVMLGRLREQGPPLLQHLPDSFWQQWLPTSELHRLDKNTSGRTT